MNITEDDNNEADVRSELEQFLHHTQYYLTQLQKIKTDLNELDRRNQSGLYIETLGGLKISLHDVSWKLFLSDLILKNASSERHEFYVVIKSNVCFI